MHVKFDHVFQFKVTLKGIKPPVWRRIVIPCDYDFWDLHIAIQDAFGWLDYHLHEFTVRQPALRMELRIGIPDDEGFSDDIVLPGWMILLAHHITLANRRVTYTYDFGDDWCHDVMLEKILPRDKAAQYPQCTGGRRACPPEDCGGTWGYEHMLEVLADPGHDEHESMREWVGEGFDPKHFDKDEVEFDDPLERRDLAFGKRPMSAGPPDLRLIPGREGSADLSGTDSPPSRDDAVRVLPAEFEKLLREESEGFRGFPVATVALYGPDNKRATKIAVGIMASDEDDVGQLERWTVDEGDIRESAAAASEILTFIKKNGVRTIAMSDGVMGCPHEEGVDYPEGEVCPQCPYWARHDRWTGEPIQ